MVIPFTSMSAAPDRAGSGPVSFSHKLPFGAEGLGNGRVRFKLWAPAQKLVSLALKKESTTQVLPMTAGPDGMFTLVSEHVDANARYQFILGNGQAVPDPASRFQPEDVHGPSQVINPESYNWQNSSWRGRPWEEVVLYEAHVGCFSPEGTYDGMRRKLDHLVDIGVTALELMPLSDFEGRRNWGYDGVLPFAPDSAYGTPEDLKRLIDEAHGRELMMFLDVVYNHFGPSGNYLGLYAPDFFTDRYNTPWGGAVNFASPHVRAFFIHNALYWLNEYRFDGIRFDAVHAIYDDSRPDILDEIAARVRKETAPDRHVHLILENDNNQSRYLERSRSAFYDGQWNDDYHHAAHVLVTGERHAHYADYAAFPATALAACLRRGFVYNEVPSGFRGGEMRGESTTGLPPMAFVNFLQNHDQIGNRGDGARLSSLISPEALRALTILTLLSPSTPLLFMGEEWASARPFHFFCDFKDELAAAVREGRRKEFERQNAAGLAVGVKPTDPNAIETFELSKLDWTVECAAHHDHLAFVRGLLQLRGHHIRPHLAGAAGVPAHSQIADERSFLVQWRLAHDAVLTIAANLSSECIGDLGWVAPGEELLAPGGPSAQPILILGPWEVRVRLAQNPR